MMVGECPLLADSGRSPMAAFDPKRTFALDVNKAQPNSAESLSDWWSRRRLPAGSSNWGGPWAKFGVGASRCEGAWPHNPQSILLRTDRMIE